MAETLLGNLRDMVSPVHYTKSQKQAKWLEWLNQNHTVQDGILYINETPPAKRHYYDTEYTFSITYQGYVAPFHIYAIENSLIPSDVDRTIVIQTSFGTVTNGVIRVRNSSDVVTVTVQEYNQNNTFCTEVKKRFTIDSIGSNSFTILT